MTGKKKNKKKLRTSENNVPYEEMSVKELRIELRRRKLGQIGSKATLVDRLRQNDAGVESAQNGSVGSDTGSNQNETPTVFSFMSGKITQQARTKTTVESDIQLVTKKMTDASASGKFDEVALLASQLQSLSKELQSAKDENNSDESVDDMTTFDGT